MANYTSPHMFNIVLNSQNAVTSNPNNCTYYFNFSNIPAKKYRVGFAYKGKNNADFVANDSPQVFLQMNTTPSVYQATSVDASQVSYYLGSLRADTHAAAQVYFYANLNDNADIFINFPPRANTIQVIVTRDDFSTPFTTLAGSNLADYVLCLLFVEVY